jgi:hypothetical protein
VTVETHRFRIRCFAPAPRTFEDLEDVSMTGTAPHLGGPDHRAREFPRLTRRSLGAGRPLFRRIGALARPLHVALTGLQAP